MSKTLIAAAALAAFSTTAVLAQDYSLTPTYDTYTLNGGFLPDPYELDVVAGGSVEASNVGCSGYISNAPDVRLMWNGGSIGIGARSSSDTTLVINAPDGNWYCSDDVDGFNPYLNLSGAGQYDIWIGTYDGGTANAVVYATEYGSPQ